MQMDKQKILKELGGISEDFYNELIHDFIAQAETSIDKLDKAKESDGFVTITYKDSGIGMTKNQIDNIFEEFYKADESRHDLHSVGLGLTICKRIIEKHGGKIWVESQGIGKGSTFYFSLKSGKNK